MTSDLSYYVTKIGYMLIVLADISRMAGEEGALN